MMKFALGIVGGLLLLCGQAQARDVFDTVSCNADFPKALIGKAMPTDAAVAIEDRHKALSLHDEGADEVNDDLGMVSWSICGHSYDMLIDGKNVMRDVIRIPDHSRATPAFAGDCQVGGKTEAEIYAVLDNKAHFDPNPEHHYATDDKTLLPAIAAWRIDEKHAKFATVPVAGMMCPRSGLFTMDGGS
jgi:hypothetical protein